MSKSTQTDTTAGVTETATNTTDTEHNYDCSKMLEVKLDDNDDGYCTFHG